MAIVSKISALMGTVFFAANCFAAPTLELRLPLRRTAYQTNEKLNLALVRTTAGGGLAATDLTLDIRGEDGSVVHVVLPLPAVAAKDQGATSATDHVGLDARLLRPGSYVLTATAEGVTSSKKIDICSHIRKTPFRLMVWGGSGRGAEQALAGENGTGLNLQYGADEGYDQDANIRGGMDYMRNDTMGGAHQMDGRQECDWSDPNVLIGGNARVARQVLLDRTKPNVIGVHCYDEPGLTWGKNPITGLFSPHNIPSQDWAYKAAFGKEPILYTSVKLDDAQSMNEWDAWLRWKQVFMEAAWRNAAFSVNYAAPDMVTTTQSMYAWYAFGDGYYSDIARALPVMSGHGGYDDLAGGYLCPGFFFEFGRARDFDKPVWYLPQWWGSIPSPLFRLEQYLTFMMGPQGIMVPPAAHCEAPGLTPQSSAILESNRLMARLGPIFTVMPATRPEVAVLYSMSQNTKAMAASENLMLAQDFPGQVERLLLLYTAGKMAHIPLFPVVEEDVLDGSVAANHKVLILTGIERLDPKVVASLEAWIARGGKVIVGDECKVAIAGATKLGAEVHTKIYSNFKNTWEDTSVDVRLRRERAMAQRSPSAYYREGAPIAAALTKRCRELGVRPIVDCDATQVVVSRHAYGDVEYLFFVNAATDEEGVKEGKSNSLRAINTGVSVPDEGRPVYDAVLSGEAPEFRKQGDRLAAALRFGPGQMRVFARTARPLGAMRLATPVVEAANFSRSGAARPLAIRASVVDTAGAPLNAIIPLRIQVHDPLGGVRYDLYRATQGSDFRLDLPLAINDPAGAWTVRVTNLLTGQESTASFSYLAPAQVGAIAGLVSRAVYFSADIDPVFRFFKVHRNIALIPGTNRWEKEQAERLASNLKRWGVTATVVAAGDVKKKDRPKDLWPTWSGARGDPDFDMPAEGAILLGAAAQHPMIQTMLPGRQTPTHLLLPYLPEPGVFPGPGRGMVAWQTDAVGFGNYETITLIADDAAGMSEAAGTLFEMLSGFRRATDWVLPGVATVTPASRQGKPDVAFRVVSETRLNDRAVAVEALSGGGLVVLGQDGTLTRRDDSGKILWTATVAPGVDGVLRLALSPDGSLIVVSASSGLVGLDGEGHEQFRYSLRFESLLLKTTRPDYATCLAVAPDGSRVAAGTWDGRIILLDRKGKPVTVAGGISPEEHAVWQTAQREWAAGQAQRDADKKANEALKAAKVAYDKAMAAWMVAPKAERGPAPKAPEKQKKLLAAPKYPGRESLTSLAFSADGKVLLGLTSGRGMLLSADGRELGAVDGVSSTATPVAVGENFLVPGKASDRVLTVAAADGKVVGEVSVPLPPDAQDAVLNRARNAIPRDRIVSITSLPEGSLVARAQEGAVHRYQADGKEAWVSAAPAVTKLVRASKDRAAVAYWGGLLRVLDLQTGQVRAAQTYETDIAEITWLGNDLVVALADGRVLRVAIP